MVVEGVKTCKTAYYLSRSKNIETPIIDAVYDVLFNQIEPEIVLKKIND
jgi:glycerol-3-phosphate dehydrogenase